MFQSSNCHIHNTAHIATKEKRNHKPKGLHTKNNTTNKLYINKIPI